MSPESTSEFNKLYEVLNPAQKKAVDSIDGPVMVIAGPGTGKTTILTLRIANILKETDTAPDSILALTFTESGAYAMRRKLVEIIGSAAYKVNIQTFHGFAESIIQKYPDYFPRIIGSKIITDAEQIKIMEKLIDSKSIKILRPYGDPRYYVRPVLSEIQVLKRENVSPAELKASVERDQAELEESGNITAAELEKLTKRNEKNLELAFLYEKYEEQLAEEKFYDFDDMLLELIRAMEENDLFKLILQETYQYILADEHQDANASQNRILELLSDFDESPNLFIVGDDKQAIYRFQGASLDNFLFFSRKYKQAKVIDLEHNYRSHQGILDASHSLIMNNPGMPGRERQKLISLQIGTKPIFVDEFPTLSDELDYIATLIERLVKKGEKSEEVAVLYRENKEAERISAALTAHGVIHRIESDHNILNDINSAKIIILCRAINDPSNSEYLGQALLLPELKNDPAAVSGACVLANRQVVPLAQIIKKDRSLKDSYGRVVKWSGESQTMPFPDFLQKLIQETNILASIIAAPDSLEQMSSLEAFFEKIVKAAQSKNTFYIKDFIEYIGIVSAHGLATKRSYVDHVGGVRLMTAHKSKGQEFNHVFMVNVIDGLWGNRTERNRFNVPIIEHTRVSGRIEDERRLFYVAMTRARESVNISYGRSNGEKETIASQFIAEIDPSLIAFDKPVIADQTELFAKKMKSPEIQPTLSLIKPEFVREKFLSQPFSVTHLNNYLKCPWYYFFVNLIRIPQSKSKHQMYGTAIHETLDTFFNAYKEERDLSKKQLLELFKHNLGKEPLSVADLADSWEKGKKALEGYFTAYSGLWGRALLTEYSIRGHSQEFKYQISNIKYQNLELTGKIDKLEFINEQEVIVIDYKTAKPKSRNEIEGKTKNADGNYKRQLVFYKLLLNLDKKYTMKYGEIDFIEPNERGIYKKERFEIDGLEVAQLVLQIEKVATEIIELKFLNSTCDDKDCEYCKLGKILKS